MPLPTFELNGRSIAAGTVIELAPGVSIRAGEIMRRDVVLVAAPADEDAPEGGERSVEGDAPITRTAEGKVVGRRMVLATEGVATDGGILRMAGCDLTRFTQNPVMLAFHDMREWPIGSWDKVRITSKRLEGTPVFHGLTDDSKTAATLYEAGEVRASSVGFIVTKARARWGTDAETSLTKAEEKAGAWWVADEWQLLETSIVPVGADPGALAKTEGRDADEDTRGGSPQNTGQTGSTRPEGSAPTESPAGDVRGSAADDAGTPKDPSLLARLLAKASVMGAVSARGSSLRSK